MKKTLLITIALIALLALYKKQHIQPVDNPKDSPLFQQRLQSSLKRFQEDGFPDRLKGMQEREEVPGNKAAYPQQLTPALSDDLIVNGRCGTVYLTWVEEKHIAKELVQVKRKTPEEDFSPLKDKIVYEREEAQGTRYWIVDSGLTNDHSYEYLVSFKDAGGKEIVKGPVSLTLACTEKDREMLAQREKRAKEYSQQKPSSSPLPTAKTGEVIAAGRCGRATLTWVEEKGIKKETITIKRKSPDKQYTTLDKGMVYERVEGNRVRYWVPDSGLTDGVAYEYLISFKDASGKETVKGTVLISLTCTEKDREIQAQREQAIREYYQKKGIDYEALKTSPYKLGDKEYTITIGNSPQKGNVDAPITMVVFTDFECVHCSTWAQTLESIQNTFPHKVKVVFKNYPIPYHQKAQPAAMAALAAGEQGKFWEMHDLLFKNQNALGYENLLGYAKTLGLEEVKFQKALESAKLKSLLEQDTAQGKTLGVQNIPTTFINGRSLVGSPPAPYMKGLIEDILKNKIK